MNGDPTTADATWEAASRQRLQHAIDRLVDRLRPPADAIEVAGGASGDDPGRPAALDRVVEVFGLTAFERDVLVLTAGLEVDPRVAELLDGPDCRGGASFALALDRLPGAHWSALAPTAPLQRWLLVRHDDGPLVRGRIQIDDRVLLALLGVSTVDRTVDVMFRPLPAPTDPRGPVDRAAGVAAEAWRSAADAPALQIVASDRDARAQVAALAADRMGMRVLAAPARALPTDTDGLDRLTRLIEREAGLADTIVAIELDDDPTTSPAVDHLVERVAVPLFALTRDRVGRWDRHAPAVELDPAPPAEQAERWRRAVGDAKVEVDALADAFPLGDTAIADAVAEARAAGDTGEFATTLWEAARRRSRRRLEGHAQRLDGSPTWDDLVLPAATTETLRRIGAHVRYRRVLHHDWGFAGHPGTPLAVTALFHGPSGVGKTLAARVLAASLGLDLYRVDLSRVVSKYIGETEKNLRAIFDAAETTSMVLLFDEADAIFGTRSEVSDAHDRYANIEVSYLLQRIEAFTGLAVLTSNLPANIDPAFVRRIRYSVEFPFPDVAARETIWRRAFPVGTPTKPLDPAALAQLSITGASIASIALGAAVLAADEARPVTMAHVLAAVRAEYDKLDRQLTPVELRGWPDELRDAVTGGRR